MENRDPKKKFMQRAVKRPGALTRKAKKAHMSLRAYEQKHKHDSGRTGKQARLAMIFNKYRPGKKRRKGRKSSR